MQFVHGMHRQIFVSTVQNAFKGVSMAYFALSVVVNSSSTLTTSDMASTHGDN